VLSQTRSLDATTRAKAGAMRAAGQARQVADQAREAAGQAREAATTQLTPLARSAQLTARRGMYEARAWAAPRVERTGLAVQERLAPRVSSMMVATARRIEPAQAKSRRRWPAVLAGIIMLATGGVAGALLRSQRNKADSATAPPPAMPPASAPAESREVTDTQADVNGQVRTP
jgi:hypothetical protein